MAVLFQPFNAMLHLQHVPIYWQPRAAWCKVLTFGWGSPCGWLCMLACAPTRQQLICSPASSGEMRRGLVAVWLLELIRIDLTVDLHFEELESPALNSCTTLANCEQRTHEEERTDGTRATGKPRGASQLAKLCDQTFCDSDM